MAFFDMVEWIGFVLAGASAGFVGGLLGVGGGLVTVPSMLIVFYLTGKLQMAHEMQVAVGTSLAAMMFTAASSALSHYFRKGIIWHLFLALSPGIVFGAILGAIVADDLPSSILKIIFGVCSFLIGLYFLCTKERKETDIEPKPRSKTVFFSIGILTGFISSILGIGGGIITVPFLTSMKTPIRNAISTSAATGFLIALFGALSFMFLGLKQESLGNTLGYVYLPAFLIIGIVSILFAPLGTKCAYTWPTSVLRKLFALYLIAVGLAMAV